MSLFDFFDAWEPLFKARKAKGLDKWERLQNISQKLQGKDVKAISYTCCHPSHGGEPVRHLLGSVEGNLHFLMGYGNPNFHIAPYHWQIVDPNLTDEEASATQKRMGHPTNPLLWEKSGFDSPEEGDIAEGTSHPLYEKQRALAKKEKERKQEAIKLRVAAGEYQAIPSEGVVEGLHNNHVYRWDLIKDSFFSAMNPEVAQAMNDAAIVKSGGSIHTKVSSGIVKSLAKPYLGEPFEPEVWPLVKSRFPRPGSVLTLEATTGETVYGVVTPSKLLFFQKNGEPASVVSFDKTYTHFDLVKSGNVPPVSLLTFIAKTFKIDQNLVHAAASSSSIPVTKISYQVDGDPSPGWENVDPETGRAL